MIQQSPLTTSERQCCVHSVQRRGLLLFLKSLCLFPSQISDPFRRRSHLDLDGVRDFYAYLRLRRPSPTIHHLPGGESLKAVEVVGHPVIQSPHLHLDSPKCHLWAWKEYLRII
jgi:hypothetical protein